jgi:hypothetical protein
MLHHLQTAEHISTVLPLGHNEFTTSWSTPRLYCM